MANWYYFRNKRIEGPVDDDALRNLIESQAISGETLLWSTRLDAWVKLREIDPLKLTLKAPARPASGERSAGKQEDLPALENQEPGPGSRSPSPRFEIRQTGFESRETEPASAEPEPEAVEREPVASKPQPETGKFKFGGEPGATVRKPQDASNEPRFNDWKSAEPEGGSVPDSQAAPPSRDFPPSNSGGFMSMQAQGSSGMERPGMAGPEKFRFSIPGLAEPPRAGGGADEGAFAGPGVAEEEFSFAAAAESSRDTAGEERAAGAVRPWVRFTARIVDHLVWLYLFSALLYLLDLYAGPALNAYLYYRPEAFPYAEYVPYLIIFLLYMLTFILFEALLLSTAGATVGKWLLGTSVRAYDEYRLGYLEALARGLGVWVKGLGLGIPVVSLVTLIVSYGSLTGEHGKTSWDRSRDSNVLHKRLNPFGISAVVVILLASAAAALAALVVNGIIEAPGYISGPLFELLAMLNISP